MLRGMDDLSEDPRRSRAMKLHEVLLRASAGKIKWCRRQPESVGISERQLSSMAEAAGRARP